MRRTLIAACALLFGLSACTPEQIELVQRYAAEHAETVVPARSADPAIVVDAVCGSLTVHGENWPDDSFISVGIEAQPGFVLQPAGGIVDESFSSEFLSTLASSYYWSVVGRVPTSGEMPTVRVDGTVDC